MIVIGPALNTGIGHHAKKYTNVFPNSEYYMFGSQLPEVEHALIFMPVSYTHLTLPTILRV